jgi:hypothetical protein
MNIESDLLYTCIMQLISKYKDEIKERLEINVPTSTAVAITQDVQKSDEVLETNEIPVVKDSNVSTEIQQPPAEEIQITRTLQDELNYFLEEVSQKNNAKCKSCLKSFASEYYIKRHLSSNKACEKLLEVSSNDKHKIPSVPINKFINKTLKASITGTQPTQCKYCEITFSNNFVFTNHFVKSVSCNRLAFLEFKKLFNGEWVE